MRLSGSIIPIFIIFNHDLVLMYAVEVSLIWWGLKAVHIPIPGLITLVSLSSALSSVTCRQLAGLVGQATVVN
jgi:hypothetical protein